jgi:hypothetical protein
VSGFKVSRTAFASKSKGSDSIDCRESIESDPFDLDAKAVRDTLNPDTLPLFKAMLILAQMGEDSLIPYFGGNDSVGSVMRKRLEPLIKPLLAQTTLLLK